MAGKLSFSIAINLLTENFKRGTNQVKNAFRSMQAQVLTFAAALGVGGIGLSNLVSRFVEVARETSRVTTSLKNVSGSMSQYADNQKYLLDIAKKYGLEINALTGNFAKFTAAASISGMSMENQRKIFESVSRACTAFGMNADDSNGVMLALSQMMSKGKISSEELRLQMGERLPIALQAMAKAAGVSVAGLDKLLKQGKLMSADVLPKFAEALNEMIPNVDTDNLETSVNRLKNKFTELVNSMDVQSKYKALIDWLSSILSSLQAKVSSVIAFIITLISGKLIQSVVSYFGKISNVIDTTLNKAKVAEEQKLLATQKRIEAEKVYEATLAAYNIQENGERLASKSQLTKAEKVLQASVLAEKRAIDAAKVASDKAAAVQTTTIWGRAAVTVKMAWASVAMTLKTLWSAVWPMALISAIGLAVGKLVDMYQEAKRVKNIFSDYKKELSSVSNTSEIAQLRVLQKLYNEATGNKKLQEQYQKRIESVVGEQIKKEQNINDVIKKRIKLLEATATADFYTQKKVGAQDKINQLSPNAKLNGISQGNFDYLMQNMAQYNETGNKNALQKAINTYAEHIRRTGKEFAEDYEDKLIEISGYWQIAKHASSKIEDNMKYVVQNDTKTIIPVTDPGDDKKQKKTTLQKQQESYYKQFEELGAELEIGKITQAEYNKALGELNIKMYAQAKGTNDKNTLESDYFKNLKVAAEKAIANQDKNAALVELEKVQRSYNDKLKETQQQYNKGLLSQRELNDNIVSLSVEAAKSAAGIKGIGDSADGFITAMQLNAKLLASPIKVKSRDATFDYKKTETDIASENLDKAKEVAEAYKQQWSKLGLDLTDEIANAMANVPDLESKLKIAQVKQDIKELSKELNESLYSGVKDIAGSSDRMVNAFESLRDVFNDVDASGWERIMAVWNTMTNTVDALMSIAKTIESLTELTEKLGKAKEAEAAIDTVATQTKVTNAVTGATASMAAAATEKTAATGEVAANTAKGASAAGASAAKLPFPWNIVAIGGAIAAAMAAFAVIPKFAGGGIIAGGPTSGDKILARVNAGEMILNGSQQSNLFDAINSGNIGGGKALSSSVSTKVRAKDLILTINNELKSQGKKPIS